MNSPALVFDLGGVLIDWDPRHLYRKIFVDEREMERFLDEVGLAEWNSRQDAGRPFAEAVAELVERFPGREAAIRAFWDRWEETIAGPIAGTVDILARLRGRGLPLHAISNWSAETFPRARPRFPFLDWFGDFVISGTVGVCKPDPAIYRLFLQRTGLQPEQCVFVDDSLPNVQAARGLGFGGVHFRSPRQLADELQKLGVPAGGEGG